MDFRVGIFKSGTHMHTHTHTHIFIPHSHHSNSTTWRRSLPYPLVSLTNHYMHDTVTGTQYHRYSAEFQAMGKVALNGENT